MHRQSIRTLCEQCPQIEVDGEELTERGEEISATRPLFFVGTEIRFWSDESDEERRC